MSDTGCPRYDYSELFWFGSIDGGPKTVSDKSYPPIFFSYWNIETGLHSLLIKYFPDKSCAPRYFQSLRKISVMVYIAGKFGNYDNKSGVHNVRYTKAKHDMSFDLHITEEQWAEKTATEFQTFYAELMRQGLQKCLERAKKIKGEVIDEEGFVHQYEAAIKEFLETTYPKDEDTRPGLSEVEMEIIYGSRQ